MACQQGHTFLPQALAASAAADTPGVEPYPSAEGVVLTTLSTGTLSLEAGTALGSTERCEAAAKCLNGVVKMLMPYLTPTARDGVLVLLSSIIMAGGAGAPGVIGSLVRQLPSECR